MYDYRNSSLKMQNELFVASIDYTLYFAQILHLLFPLLWLLNLTKAGRSRFCYLLFFLLYTCHDGWPLKGIGRRSRGTVVAVSSDRRGYIISAAKFSTSSPTAVNNTFHIAFIRNAETRLHKKCRQNTIRRAINQKSENEGGNIATEQVSADGNAELKKPVTIRRVPRKTVGTKRMRPGQFSGPLTIADVIKYRMIPQPPSLEETQKVIERKPWKRMNITEKIKQEKQKIEETDRFLDDYFHGYLVSKGTDAGLSGGVQHIDISLFKRDVDVNSSSSSSIYKYNADELLKIWNNKGGYFYTNMPKTVAMLQIVRKIAKESNADQQMKKTLRDHVCFKRIVGSVVRHMKYVTRIKLPNHLKNYDKLMNMVPMFNEQQMVTIFSVLAYLGFKKEKVVDAMLNHARPFKRFKPEEMRAIIMACLSMKFDPSTMVEEYIEKLKVAMKDGKHPKEDSGEDDMGYYLDVLNICSKTDHMNSWIFHHIADFMKNRDKMCTEDVVEAICAFTNLQHLDEELFSHLYELLMKNIASLKGKKLVKNLIVSLSVCHFKPPKELVDHLASMVLKDLKSFSLVELALSLRSLALLDNYSEELYRKVFSLDIFSKPPSVKVLQQINLQVNKNRAAYSAYLHPASSSVLNTVFGNVYQAYLGYKVLSKGQSNLKLQKDAENKLKEIYTSGVKNWTFTSSSLHLQVRDLIKEAYGIDCDIEYVTNEGLVLDIAILPSSLDKYTKEIGAKDFLKDKKCAIEVHGPFHYLQKSTEEFPPPLDNPTLYKERILKETGWDVSHLHYWSFVPWMKREHKIKVLGTLLPDWVKKLCNNAERSKSHS
ncbi:hypothetical protein BgAZ_104270 [Babesia gibsoni]|uniref:RAP domain-containing protein n=1 Tax=Babesia gibsoni TaxID=33632 RepID=A0AAD8UT58_BABGI|nr:hypothetical protein BgAZ_104270 [Babesia gibsoni]